MWLPFDVYNMVSEMFLNGDQFLVNEVKRRMHRKGFFVMTIADVDLRATDKLPLGRALYEIETGLGKSVTPTPGPLNDGGPQGAWSEEQTKQRNLRNGTDCEGS